VQRASAYSCIGGGAPDPPDSEGDTRVAKARLRAAEGSCRAFFPKLETVPNVIRVSGQTVLSRLPRTRKGHLHVSAYVDDMNNTSSTRLSANVGAIDQHSMCSSTRLSGAGRDGRLSPLAPTDSDKRRWRRAQSSTKVLAFTLYPADQGALLVIL
jgi:hypothetical protein